MHLNASMESSGDDHILPILIISSVSLMTLISTLVFCLCCRRRNPKSELAGVEGIVKLKHLDDSNLTVSIDTTDSVNVKTKLSQKNATLPLDAKLNGFHDNYELKRSSANAPHRSLPDIPIAETAERDNNSELYATVGDKFQEKPQIRNSANIEKLANVSQHSSMSQADVSSPYARVKPPAHAYDKLKKTEHPYAQVVQPTNGGIAQVVDENDDEEDDDEDEDDDTAIENPIAHRESSSNNDLNPNNSAIDASAAISGRISASQELPYMTPPITGPQNQQQHFSGDSQDSSKGYTSISVREPLANIIAQTNKQNAERRRRQVHDSHYATVSDDSEEETYAAIEEPNNAGELLYTSGSETYAQIQAPITVSVEINPVAPIQPPPPTQSTNRFSRTNPISTIDENVESLKNLHSRQASSSSCTSSVGNISSPKPEKRQANSPLPPTPKSQHHLRNSTSSIMEYQEGAKIKDSNNNSNKVKQSPSKDLEGMYAKVMKKNKLSSLPVEAAFPLIETTPKKEPNNTMVNEIQISNEYETIDKKRNRQRNSNSNGMSDGYETIPAADRNNNKDEDTPTPHYAKINEKTSKAKMSLFQDLQEIDDPKYETLKLDKKPKAPSSIATDSDYDPNYEIVINKKTTNNAMSDEGYAQIKKTTKDSSDDESIPGYSTIKKVEPDYSIIQGGQMEKLPPVNSINEEIDIESNIYQSIPAVVTPTDSNSSDNLLDTTTSNTSVATPTTINNYESLSNSESTTLDEPNYESMKYLNENPYERLDDKGSGGVSPVASIKSDVKSPAATVAPPVDDFFKV